ncbi:MAG: hypothetical protein KKG04_02100 [Candidatus Thermoplasmatota archaeon]|nr:hypothetical protein [Candidatus Thermoplasmatota archaeon]
MNKHILTGIILLLLMSTIGSAINIQPTSEQGEIHETLAITSPFITVSDQYSKITLAETDSMLMNPGEPMIPQLIKTYILPFGATIDTLDVTFLDNISQAIEKPLQPASSPQPINTNLPRPSHSATSTSKYEIYPLEPFSYTIGTGLHDNNHVTFLSIHIYPIRYQPAEQKLTITSTIDLTIQYTIPPESFIIPTETLNLAIIAPEEFSNALQPLITHKNNHNMTTQLFTTETIYTQYSGRDNPEKIKYAIKDLIETQGISYVLLIGSLTKLPIRYSAIHVYNENTIPTDLYYADVYDSHGIFCSWDSNHNNIFGEYNWDDGMIDEVDLYADVHIGRYPCTTQEEVNTVVSKIITYETTTASENWFNTLVLMGGDTFPNHGNIEGEFVTQKIAEVRPEFTAKKIWTSQRNYNPFTIDFTLSQGAGFVSYSGHGYEQGFGTSPPNVEKRIEYWSPYIIGLLNRNKLPIIFFDACSTSKLDFDLEGFEEFYPYFSVIIKALQGSDYDPTQPFPCFSWQLIKKPTGGAIATIGSTRVAFTHVDNGGIHGGASYLNYHFFQAYTQGITVSEMLTSAQNNYINNVGYDCVTLEEFILLGDPSLRTGGY